MAVTKIMMYMVTKPQAVIRPSTTGKSFLLNTFVEKSYKTASGNLAFNT